MYRLGRLYLLTPLTGQSPRLGIGVGVFYIRDAFSLCFHIGLLVKLRSVFLLKWSYR
jgi:hypothetical protein